MDVGQPRQGVDRAQKQDYRRCNNTLWKYRFCWTLNVYSSYLTFSYDDMILLSQCILMSSECPDVADEST